MGMKYSKLSPRQSGELLKLFVSGSTARAAGEVVGVYRNTAALFFTKIRRLIAEYPEQKMSEAFEGAVENDESYFGGKRKGIRGRGAAGKIAVFGILKLGGSVYAQMIANCGQSELVPIIRRKVSPASVVFSDSWGGYALCSWRDTTTKESTTTMNWLIPRAVISMASRIFGTKPKGICASSMVFPKAPFLCSFKSACGDSIPEDHLNSLLS